MGPDLSSLGTSSPVETIISSILFPSQSIKEGYELQNVVKKDGSKMMGYLVSNASSEIVIRDMTGMTASVAKNQIDVFEKIPGSLMPPGLTAGLEKKEFIDLVGFLSKLGESGKFRVPNAQFVRRWETVSGNKELSKKISDEGLGHIVKENKQIMFHPLYSKVSGDLPVEELPVVEVKNKQYSFTRFKVEVVSKGNVNFLFNSTAGITAWVGQKPLKLAEHGVVVDLSQGIHEFTLAIDREVHQKESLSIQLEDAENSPAQIRLILGQ